MLDPNDYRIMRDYRERDARRAVVVGARAADDDTKEGAKEGAPNAAGVVSSQPAGKIARVESWLARVLCKDGNLFKKLPKVNRIMRH